MELDEMMMVALVAARERTIKKHEDVESGESEEEGREWETRDVRESKQGTWVVDAAETWQPWLPSTT